MVVLSQCIILTVAVGYLFTTIGATGVQVTNGGNNDLEIALMKNVIENLKNALTAVLKQTHDLEVGQKVMQSKHQSIETNVLDAKTQLKGIEDSTKALAVKQAVLETEIQNAKTRDEKLIQGLNTEMKLLQQQDYIVTAKQKLIDTQLATLQAQQSVLKNEQQNQASNLVKLDNWRSQMSAKQITLENDKNTILAAVAKHDAAFRNVSKKLEATETSFENKTNQLNSRATAFKDELQTIVSNHQIYVTNTSKKIQDIKRNQLLVETNMKTLSSMISTINTKYGTLDGLVQNHILTTTQKLSQVSQDDQSIKSTLNNQDSRLKSLEKTTVTHSELGLQVRLAGKGSTRYAGRVEVYYNGEWGTVCNDLWNIADANVVCRMLGYLGARQYSISTSVYGQGTAVIGLDDLQCTGSESNIMQCPNKGGWKSHNCGHNEDVSLECYT